MVKMKDIKNKLWTTYNLKYVELFYVFKLGILYLKDEKKNKIMKSVMDFYSKIFFQFYGLYI